MTPGCEVVCTSITKVETAGEASGGGKTLSLKGLGGKAKKAASLKADHALRERQRQQETLNMLRGATLAVAASSFVAAAFEPNGRNTLALGGYMQRKVAEVIQNVPVSGAVSGDHNPIRDNLLGGNIQLFGAVSLGECVSQ